MGTRAVIIRKNADNKLEYGQTHWDGGRNIHKLYSSGWKGKTDELFECMSQRGISALGESPDETSWYSVGDTYNYGCDDPPEEFTDVWVTTWLRSMDWPEYATLLTADGDWYQFEVALYHYEYGRHAPDSKKNDPKGLNVRLAAYLQQLFYPEYT